MKFIEKNPIIMIVIGVLGISLSSIIVKSSPAPGAVTATWRLLWTVVLMTPITFIKPSVVKELGNTNMKTLLLCSLSGLFLAIHFVLWFESLKLTSVASSTSIVCTEVIWVALGYCMFLKGRLGFKAFIAIAISLIGSTIIAFSAPSDSAHILGVILALLSAVAVAVYTLLGNIVRKNASTMVYTYIVYLACSISLIIICAFSNLKIYAYSYSPVISGFMLALFSTILGHSIFSWCLKYFTPSFVSASKLLEPVVAAIIAVFIFGEIPPLLQIFGGVLILGGVYYYSLIENESHTRQK